MNALSNHIVLYVADLDLDNSACRNVLSSLISFKAQIADWVKTANRGIVAEAEYCVSASCQSLSVVPFKWLPGKITTCSQFDGCAGQTVTITNANILINQGLTSGSLSNWSYSFHCQFTGGKYHTVATSTAASTHPVTRYKTMGFGSIVVTCQDPAWHYAFGGISAAGTFLNNMLTWAA